MPEILIVYYSRTGNVAQLARLVARGVEEVPGMRARVRSVPPVAPVTKSRSRRYPKRARRTRRSTICANARVSSSAARPDSATWPRR